MTIFVDADSIIIPENRQRREFDLEALTDLMASVQDSAHGLLHPLVVRQDAGKVLLVAGERRLRVIKEIYELGGCFKHAGAFVPTGKVPIVSLGDLPPLEAFEAELEENIRRKDLTVLEQAQATAQLYSLRAQQAQAAGSPPPTAADLAREIYDMPPDTPAGGMGSAQAAVRSQLLVAKHAANPAVRKATSLKEAVNIIKKQDQQDQATRLAGVVGKTYSTKELQLLNEDSLKWMAGAAPGQFDIILTDPPYGMGADQFNDSGKPGDLKSHFYDDSYETWLATMQVFTPASFAVAKPQAHAYLFCDIDRFPELRQLMSAAGWEVHRTPLVWHNPDGFRAPWPDRGPQRKYELILYATKGGKKTQKLLGDVLTYRKDAQVGHPAQKPVELLKDLLTRSAVPGNKVFDPFAGSASTLEACHGLQLTCLGIEKDATAYGVGLKRVQSLGAFDESLF